MRIFGALFIVSQALVTVAVILSWVSIAAFVFLVPEKSAVFEGRLLPVISDFRIISASPFSEGASSVIYVAFDKERDCKFKGAQFIVRENDELTREVRPEFLRDEGRPPTSKPTGAFIEGPWLIDVPFEKLNNIFMFVTHHSCHIGWDTVTKEAVNVRADLGAAGSSNLRSNGLHKGDLPTHGPIPTQSQADN